MRSLSLLLTALLLMGGCPRETDSLTLDLEQESPGPAVTSTDEADDENGDDAALPVDRTFDGKWLLTSELLEEQVCVTIENAVVTINDTGCDGQYEALYLGTRILGDAEAAVITWQYDQAGSPFYRHQRIELTQKGQGTYQAKYSIVYVDTRSDKSADIKVDPEAVFERL